MTLYTPPLPKYAPILTVVGGLFVVIVCAYLTYACYIAKTINVSDPRGALVLCVLAAMGIFAMIAGVRWMLPARREINAFLVWIRPGCYQQAYDILVDLLPAQAAASPSDGDYPVE